MVKTSRLSRPVWATVKTTLAGLGAPLAKKHNNNLNSSASIISRMPSTNSSHRSNNPSHSSDRPVTTFNPRTSLRCVICLPIPALNWVARVLRYPFDFLRCIVLAGCTSTSLSNVYLLSLRYMPINSQPSAVWGQKNSNIPVTFAGPSGELRTPPLEIKVSYLSICISNIERIELCSSNEVALESVIRLLGTQSSANNSSAADPLNIFRVAKSFGKDMLFIGPLVTTVALIVIRLFFLIKMDRREPVPIPRVYLTCAISVAMFLLCLVSALMQHVSSRDGAKSIQILMHGTVQAELGTTSIALGWVAVGLLALDSSVMLLLLLAIRASTESDMYYTPTISMEATSSQDQPDVTERASDPVVARV